MTKAEMLATINEYSEEELSLAVHAVESLRKTRESQFYFLHYFFKEQFDINGVSETGDCVIELPLSDLLMNPVGMVHGGVLATLCDNVMGLASYLRAKRTGVTLELSVRYHKPARGSHLVARGSVLAESAQFNSTRCEVFDGQGTLVTSATGTFYHSRERS